MNIRAHFVLWWFLAGIVAQYDHVTTLFLYASPVSLFFFTTYVAVLVFMACSMCVFGEKHEIVCTTQTGPIKESPWHSLFVRHPFLLEVSVPRRKILSGHSTDAASEWNDVPATQSYLFLLRKVLKLAWTLRYDSRQGMLQIPAMIITMA